MRRIERLGAELAYALRVRASRRDLWEAADSEVRRLEEEILGGDARELEADTNSFPAVPDDRPTERFHAPAQVACPGMAFCALAANDDHVHLATGQIWLRPGAETS
jgi:hypothetical protein